MNERKKKPNKTQLLNKEIVPVISLHDFLPVDFLLFNFPSTQSGASTRGGFGAVQSGNRTGKRGVVGVVSRKALKGIEWFVCQTPHLLQETVHAAETTEVTVITHRISATGDNGSEGTRWSRKHAGHEQWPDKRAIVAMGTSRNKLERVCYCGDQALDASLVAIEAGHNATKIDPGCGPEDVRYCLGKGFRANGSSCR